ncbi:UPAR/Ly6 domain-containing protein CG9338 [Drosophila montana]|uniref:UPAR/Ly6 domain-containing protein CG9338 n=1 Tax=Drosophila montana TaxID=40370 RepID=UPI00313B0105
MQYLLCFGALLTLLATAYAIRCYSCESVYETSCGENFEIENHFKYDCAFIAPPRFLENELTNKNATACLKRVFRENGVNKFVRGCYFGEVNETEIGCKLDPTLIAVQNASCHVCDNENYCNGADHPQVHLWQLPALALYLLAARWLQGGQRDV